MHDPISDIFRANRESEGHSPASSKRGMANLALGWKFSLMRSSMISTNAI